KEVPAFRANVRSRMLRFLLGCALWADSRDGVIAPINQRAITLIRLTFDIRKVYGNKRKLRRLSLELSGEVDADVVLSFGRRDQPRELDVVIFIDPLHARGSFLESSLN